MCKLTKMKMIEFRGKLTGRKGKKMRRIIKSHFISVHLVIIAVLITANFCNLRNTFFRPSVSETVSIREINADLGHEPVTSGVTYDGVNHLTTVNRHTFYHEDAMNVKQWAKL